MYISSGLYWSQLLFIVLYFVYKQTFAFSWLLYLPAEDNEITEPMWYYKYLLFLQHNKYHDSVTFVQDAPHISLLPPHHFFHAVQSQENL